MTYDQACDQFIDALFGGPEMTEEAKSVLNGAIGAEKVQPLHQAAARHRHTATAGV